MTSTSPLVHAVRAVRRGRRHLATGRLGAAVQCLNTASAFVGCGGFRRCHMVRTIVNQFALDLGVLVDVKCALVSMRNSTNPRKG